MVKIREKTYREHAVEVEVGTSTLPIPLLAEQVSEGKGRVGA